MVLITIVICLLAKGSIKMVDMYYRLVKAGLRTIQKVPDQYRDAVMADLTALTIDKNGNSTPIMDVSNLVAHR